MKNLRVATGGNLFPAYRYLQARLQKIISTCALLLIAVCFVPQPASAQTMGMVYWYTGDNVPISSLDGLWPGLTHIVVGDIYVQSDGSITYGGDPNYSTNYAAIVAAAHSHGVKVLIDIGPSGNLPAAVQNDLSTAMRNIMNVVNTYGFDGVADDWEGGWPSQSLQTTWMSSMRTGLGSKLFAVVPDINNWTYFGSMQHYVDFYTNLMYDTGGCMMGEFSWFDSALHNQPGSGAGSTNGYWSVDLSKDRAIAAGVPASKLVIGFEFAVRVWSGGSPIVSQPLQSCGSGYHISDDNYANDVGVYAALANPHRDSVTMVPWITTPSGWFADFEDPTSLTVAVNYIKQNYLGGWIAFNAHMDYLPNQTPQHPLLAAMVAAMGDTTTAPIIQSFTANPTVIASGQSSTLSWNVTGSGATALSISPGVSACCGLSGSATVKPTATTTYTLTASNSVGPASASATVKVTAAPPAITSAGSASGTAGTPFSYQITASNGPTSYGATGRPPGLSVNTSTGLISGTPTTAGTYTVGLSATNSAGTGTATLTLTVAGGTAPAVGLSPATLSFTSPAVGTASAVQYGTITNTGNASLIFPSTFVVTGSGFAFGGSGTCAVNTPYAPGASCTVGIVFTPTAAGTSTGAVTISDNASNSPQRITLTGTRFNTSSRK